MIDLLDRVYTDWLPDTLSALWPGALLLLGPHVWSPLLLFVDAAQSQHVQIAHMLHGCVGGRPPKVKR